MKYPTKSLSKKTGIVLCGFKRNMIESRVTM
jgi:hypothetical protein